MKALQTATLAAALSFAFVAGVTACGDDDNAATPPPVADGGPDGNVVPNPDAGDGGSTPCDFNAFVTGLITNSTTATALPSEDLGDSCTDKQTPFPDPLFQ